MKRLLVGLTGGMAGGKSTVAAMLSAAGCEVLDADRLVAELYAAGGEGAAAVARIAGPEVLTANGAVDRPALAARFFSDAALRREVEQAIHPLVRRLFEERAAASEADIVVLEATLLVEAGYEPAFDLVVTVEADADARLERAIARGLTSEQARARMEAQGDGAARRAAADLRIDNDGSLAELQAVVDRLVGSWTARLAAERATARPS